MVVILFISNHSYFVDIYLFLIEDIDNVCTFTWRRMLKIVLDDTVFAEYNCMI